MRIKFYVKWIQPDLTLELDIGVREAWGSKVAGVFSTVTWLKGVGMTLLLGCYMTSLLSFEVA